MLYRRLLPALLVLAVALLAAPGAASAQEDPQDLEFQQVFEQGMEAIQSGRYDESIAHFKRCIEIRPEQPTSYYNIACALSLQDKKAEALDWLEKSMEKGFLEFAHMDRDTDLDNIRKEPKFQQLVEKYSKPVLQGAVAPTWAPSAEKKGLLLMLHGNGGNAKDELARWKPAAEKLGLVLACLQGDQPGQGGAGFAYGNATETVILHEVERLAKEHGVAKDRVFLGGFSVGAIWAFRTAIRHPDVFAGVLCVGGVYEEEGNEAFLAKLSGSPLKVFLVHGKDDAATIESARGTRNELADRGIPVVLRTVPGGHDVGAAALQSAQDGLSWFLGADTGRSSKRIF